MKTLIQSHLLTAFTLVLILNAGIARAEEPKMTNVLSASGKKRPNVVWIMSEDNSCHYLKMFAETGAPTPNIEKLAAHGVTFDRAFSNSPVCSVARTTLITSIYAPRLGTQFHRKLEPAGMPPGWKLFPQYLKEAGYFTTNNAKTDYNVAMKGQNPWNASNKKATWRKRTQPDQPFFHVQTFAQSHESSLHFPPTDISTAPTSTDPTSLPLPPFFPQTKLFQYTQARYHDRIKTIDQKVGTLIEKLKADDLLDDTFIFYFGDHGGVLPRSKGYVYETGLHVPLVVYVPKNFLHLSDFQPNQRCNGFVEFVDFGPTVLRLAGVATPSHMDGKPFLGSGISANEVNQRKTALGYADRFDEKYDLVRSLRIGPFKYIRNFNAIYPNGLENQYRYKMAAYAQWRSLFKTHSLNDLQRRFFQPKPVEELYDLNADPYETSNLAHNPKFRSDLFRMRDALTKRMKSLPDTSLYPESLIVQKTTSQPELFSVRHQSEITDLLDVANLSLLPFDKAEPEIKKALDSESTWVRYWGLIVCSVFGKQAQPFAPQAEQLLFDQEPEVRLRAIEFLGVLGEKDPVPYYIAELQKSSNQATTLSLLNSLVFYTDFVMEQRTPVEIGHLPFSDKPFVRHRLDYLARPNRP